MTHDERGATAVEYALLAVFIAAVIAAARGERVEDLAAHTTATAREFFSFAWETSSAADST